MSSVDQIKKLRAQLGGPRDGALLRFALGNALLDAADPSGAAQAFAEAVEFHPDYSAAWKLKGKALTAAGDTHAAMEAYRAGITAAERSGDVQAGKEMRVFLRRLESAPR